MTKINHFFRPLYLYAGIMAMAAGKVILAAGITILTAGLFLLSNSCSRPLGAGQLLEDAGIRGGLVVHMGCDDGSFTAELHADDGYLVQGLTRDNEDLQEIRKYFRNQGLCGKVTVRHWEGEHLPYIDNLVNLIVVEVPGEVSDEEIMRVLAPGGAACTKMNGRWETRVKPRPDEIDEWTHYLYDPSNNAVSRDAVVGLSLIHI